MNRRSFLSRLTQGAIGAAVGSCVRWLPMAKLPEVPRQPRDAVARECSIYELIACFGPLLYLNGMDITRDRVARELYEASEHAS
jgi:hypothetical protein